MMREELKIKKFQLNFQSGNADSKNIKEINEDDLEIIKNSIVDAQAKQEQVKINNKFIKKAHKALRLPSIA